MTLAIVIVVALAGLVFGSFITLASYRLPRDEDIIRKPSRCPNCDTVLKAPDLVPVMSWLANKGQCRHCQAIVSSRYPIIELVTALAFLAVYFEHGLSGHAIILMGMAVALLTMIVVDLEHYLIPDHVHLWLIGLAIVDAFVPGGQGPLLWGGVAGFTLGLALCYGYKWLCGKEGLGFGDVKFLGVAGLWLGIFNLIPFLVFSGVLGIASALIWRGLGRGIYFPFGPALALSLFACMVWPEIPLAFWEFFSAFGQY